MSVKKKEDTKVGGNNITVKKNNAYDPKRAKKWKKKKDLKRKPETGSSEEATVVKKQKDGASKKIKQSNDEDNNPGTNWKNFLQKQQKSKAKTETSGKKADGERTKPKSELKSTNASAAEKSMSRSAIRKLKKAQRQNKTDGKGNDADDDDDKIWFDDVDESVLEKTCGIKSKATKMIEAEDFMRGHQKEETNSTDTAKDNNTTIEKNGTTTDGEESAKQIDSLSKPAITRHIGLDCEMVGVGFQGKESILARVSLVNAKGDCVYDEFVKNTEKVTDYRTEVSGVRPQDLHAAPSYTQVQKEVSDLLTGKILVGHALTNDLKILRLGHSRRQIRDTQTYKPFRERMKTKRPALKKLAAEVLKIQIQAGEHSSVVDAATAMKLYQVHKKEWEKYLRVKPEAAATKKKGADGDQPTAPQIHFGKTEVLSQAKNKKRNKFEKLKKLKKLREEKKRKMNTYEEDSE